MKCSLLITRFCNINIAQPQLSLATIARCGLRIKTNMHRSFFSTLTARYSSFWDAGKNSPSGAISGNTGERSDPCRGTTEGGIYYKVTLWFKGKCSHPLCFPLPYHSRPCLAHTPANTSLAYYLRFVKIHFTLTGIFQPSKPVLICLTSQSSSNSVKSAVPARPPFFFSSSRSKHAFSCATEDLS